VTARFSFRRRSEAESIAYRGLRLPVSGASDDALDVFNVPFTPPVGERSARWTARFAAGAPLAERHGQDGGGDRDPEAVLRTPAQRPMSLARVVEATLPAATLKLGRRSPGGCPTPLLPDDAAGRSCRDHNKRLSYAQCSSAWRWRGLHQRSPGSQARRSWARWRLIAFQRPIWRSSSPAIRRPW